MKRHIVEVVYVVAVVGLITFFLYHANHPVRAKSQAVTTTSSSQMPVSSSDSKPAAAEIKNTAIGPTRVSKNGVIAPTAIDSTETDEVDYSNPNTGTESTYELQVDRDSDGTIERINFPDGGWKEIDGDTVDNGDGTQTYTNDDGVEYTIHNSDESSSNADDSSSSDDDNLNSNDDSN